MIWILIYQYMYLYCNFFICRLIDSQFKFWNIDKLNFLRIFKGYINEKNFVGLVIDGDYIVCGEQFCFKIYVFYW